MKNYPRWLFGIAAASNFLVAAALLLFEGAVAALLGLDPAAGTNVFFYHFTAAMIALFGYCYLRVALDPRSFRPLIHVTAIGKLLANAAALVPWYSGAISSRLPAVLAADVVFALLFLDYLQRSR